MKLRNRLVAFSFLAATLSLASCQKTEIDPMAESATQIKNARVAVEDSNGKPPSIIVIK